MSRKEQLDAVRKGVQNINRAKERNEQVMLYVYNDYFRRWDYIGKTLPGGEWYDFNGHGPYELSADGRNHFRKGGAK